MHVMVGTFGHALVGCVMVLMVLMVGATPPKFFSIFRKRMAVRMDAIERWLPHPLEVA